MATTRFERPRRRTPAVVSKQRKAIDDVITRGVADGSIPGTQVPFIERRVEKYLRENKSFRRRRKVVSCDHPKTHFQPCFCANLRRAQLNAEE